MQRIFSTMCNKHCKDSMTELLEMTFVDYANLESMLRVRSMYEEEVEYNKIQMQKR